MSAVKLLILTLIYRAASVDKCYNKPCNCCRTENCSPINNTCENGCIDGYTGDNCYTPCPVNCINCWQNNRDTCGKCRDGYYNGYWHDEATHDHWSESCNHTCRPLCKKCYRYRTCQECVDGYYINSTYQDCRLLCPQRCVSCLSESDCTKCKPGFYGHDCSQYCGKGCNNPTCEKKTGFCNCTENYSGARCQFCKLGRYGIDCDLKCPEKCTYCNQSGMCFLCHEGFSGIYCTEGHTATHSTKETRKSYTVYIVLGTIFAILSISVVILILYWRIRKNHAKTNAVSCAKIQAMNGVCETDVACNVDMETEVYDEIPYNVSQPTADAIYLNHELDKLDLNESPESPEDGVVETIEPYTTYNTLAEDMSITCMLKDEHKKHRKVSTENRGRHSFESETLEDKKNIANRSSNVDNTFETQTSFISGATSFISGVDLEAADDYEQLQTEERMEKPDQDVEHSDDFDQQRKEQNTQKQKFKYLTARGDAGYANHHGNDVRKNGKSSRAENDYEKLEDKLGKGKGSREPKTGRAGNFDIDSDQLQKERNIQQHRAEFDSKERTKGTDPKLKYLTSRLENDNDIQRGKGANQQEMSFRAENDYQQLGEKLRKRKETRELRTGQGDNLDINNDQLQKERHIQQQNRENFEFVGQKRRKDHNELKLKYLTHDEDDNDLQDRKGKHEKGFVAESNYEKLEEKLGKERTVDEPKKGKDTVRYYDSRPLEDELSGSKRRLDSTSEHDYERLRKDGEIEQLRTSSNTTKGKLLPDEKYEHLRIKQEVESPDSENSADNEYYNLTYV